MNPRPRGERYGVQQARLVGVEHGAQRERRRRRKVAAVHDVEQSLPKLDPVRHALVR